MTMVHPKMEYAAAAVWDPYYDMHTTLRGVQCRAARWVFLMVLENIVQSQICYNNFPGQLSKYIVDY